MKSNIYNRLLTYANTWLSNTDTIDPPPYTESTFVNTVHRKSLSQGLKLVEIAVDEFESGSEAVALDIYLSGLDKIIMALPSNKCYISYITCCLYYHLYRFEKFENKTNIKR